MRSVGPDIPEKLGKYHVRDVVGHGSMGVVYAGHDPYADREVAIKVCAAADAGACSPALARKLFFNEAHIVGMLDHPNILRVFDAGEHEGVLYIVMEYLEGGETIASRCVPERLLPVRSIVEVIHTSALALDYAHRRGVVHRDVKPSNLLLTRDGRLKIADFGVAVQSVSDTTQVAGLVGSPGYMSPEQISEQPPTAQSDLYSLGVVMFELLTGQRPFVAKSLPTLIDLIMNAPPPSLRSRRPDAPAALEAVLERALHKSLDARYRSGREFAADLAAVFDDLVVPGSETPDDEKLARLAALAFFSEFSERETWELLRLASWCEFEPGDNILAEGSTDITLFVVVDGEVLVRKGNRRLTRLGAGDCFGEVGFVLNRPRTASIVAGGPVTALKLHPALLERASVDCQLRFNRAFTRMLVERLSISRAGSEESRTPALAVEA